MNTPLKPQLSEKTYQLAQTQNVYVFQAKPNLNKNQIKDLIEKEYKVEVIKLKTLNLKGKKARTIRYKQSKSSQRYFGLRANLKKAYITLKKGDVIPVFTDYNQKEGAPKN